METEVFTRKDYLSAGNGRPDWREAQAAALRRYYAQLVDERTIAQVVATIGADRLLAAADPHMNDIPLPEWDRLVGGTGRPQDGMGGRHNLLHLARPFEDLGDYATLSGLVCVAKEAARQYVEAHQA